MTFGHLVTRAAPGYVVRSGVELVNGEQGDDDGHDAEVEQLTLTIHKQRGQQVVVDKEDDEEEAELPPHYEHFAPVERLASGVDGTDIQAQHRCREEQSPQHQIDERLLSFVLA